MSNKKKLNEATAQKLLTDLLLASDAEAAINVLKETGITDIRKKNLSEFFEKRKEVIDFLRKHETELSKLNPNDLENISGGNDFLTDIIAGLTTSVVTRLPLTTNQKNALNLFITYAVQSLVDLIKLPKDINAALLTACEDLDAEFGSDGILQHP